MNFALVHTKGGVTKSTLAVNLSVWLHDGGHPVAAVDLDSGHYGNKTLSTWLTEIEPQIPVFLPQDGRELRAQLQKLAQDHHFIVADAPGGFQHTADKNIELLKHTDFAIIPVKACFSDIEPLPVVAEIVAEARSENPFLEARIVINCVDQRTRIGKNLEAFKDTIRKLVPDLPVMNQAIRTAQDFDTARTSGTTLIRSRTAARVDLEGLFGELMADMVVSINRQQTNLPPANTTLDGNNMEPYQNAANTRA